MIRLSKTARWAHDKLSAAGATGVYVVGGAVRDSLIGIKPNDFDLLATGLTIEQVLKALPGSYLKGESFGVIRWRYKDADEVEISLPRTEVSTGPGHKDFEVVVDKDISVETDLSRRDFTMNSMAWDIDSGTRIDPSNGAFDVVQKIIKVTDAKAFRDDPLRILRGFVLVARFGFDIDPFTKYWMQKSAAGINDLPAERIQEELDKIFEAPYTSLAIWDMQQYGILKYILPEVANSWDYDQNNPHHQKLLGYHQHSTLVLVESVSDDPDLKLAALLHDIGKPDSAWVDPVTGSNHFYMKKFWRSEWPGEVPEDAILVKAGIVDSEYWIGQNHEYVGASLAERRLRNLKYPEKRIVRICKLIGAHMWAPFTSERGARRFLNKHGDLADDLIILRYGDNGGKMGEHYQTPGITLADQQALLDRVRADDQPTRTADLAVNGHDLIEAGFKPGPEMGILLNKLTDVVLDQPELNTKDELIDIAKGHIF